MIEECVHFYADNLRLEGVLTYNEDATSSPAILLCAPHPNLGGDMDNNVITSLARVSADMGFASIRFNYRGVGKSESPVKDIAQNFQYREESLNGGNYADAVTDTHAALKYLVSQVGMNNEFFIASEVFDSLLEEAKYLNEHHFKDSAAILCRVVIEDTLKRLARKESIDDSQKASKLNDDLKSAGVINQPQWRQNQTWLDIGNDAAHGKFDTYDETKVNSMIEGIKIFLSTEFK